MIDEWVSNFLDMANDVELEGDDLKKFRQKLSNNFVEGELVYIANPFTHPDKTVEEKRYEWISKLCIDLMNQGVQVFSPIAYGLPLAKFGELPTDWGYWHSTCKVFLSRCQRMIVVMFDGWENSEGVQGEIEYANSIGIEIEYLNP